MSSHAVQVTDGTWLLEEQADYLKLIDIFAGTIKDGYDTEVVKSFIDKMEDFSVQIVFKQGTIEQVSKFEFLCILEPDFSPANSYNAVKLYLDCSRKDFRVTT